MNRPGTTADRVTREWNATSYHKVAAPQTSWGQKVLGRLTLADDACVIDAGCGSGRLTEDLLERVPRGSVIAIDRSWNMLQTARTFLERVEGDHGLNYGFIRNKDYIVRRPQGRRCSTRSSR